MRLPLIRRWTVFFLVLFAAFSYGETNVIPLTNNILPLSNLLKLAEGTRNGDLFYNIGVAYLQEDNTGQAVLYLKRAYILNPYDGDIKEALNYARGKIGIPAYIFEQTPLEKIILFPFQIFTVNVMAIIGLVFAGLGSILLSLKLSRLADKSFLGKIKKLTLITVISLILGLTYIGASIIRYSLMFQRNQAVVVRTTELLETPSSGSEKLEERVDAGLECVIERESPGYYLVKAIDGKIGWLEKESVTRLW